MARQQAVAPFWLAHLVQQLVDDDILPIMQVRLHAAAVNAEPAGCGIDRPKDQGRQQQCLNDIAQLWFRAVTPLVGTRVIWFDQRA
jgi:hypothetical protein